MGEVIEIRREPPEHAITRALRVEGNRAWKHLQRLGRTRRKLSLADRTTLARRLHTALDELFRERPALKRGAFAAAAGLGDTSRELWRLTLGPQDDDVGRLRADAERYMRVVSALHEVLGNDLDAFVYEFTLGTSLHPSELDPVRVEGDATLLDAIRTLARQVSEAFDLPAKFTRIAHARSQTLRDGARNVWPYHSGVADMLPVHGSGEETGDPRLMLPDHAFWPPAPDERARKDSAVLPPMELVDEALALLPHAHLAMYWDDEFRPDVEVAWQCEQKYGGYSAPITGTTKFDCEPRRVVVDERTGKPSYVWQVAQPAALDYWLVLYPSKDLRGVVPLLWSAGGDYDWQNVTVEVLTLTTLEKLRRIPSLSREGGSLYQCLRHLIGDGDEERIPLYERWRETAPLVDRNPFLDIDRANDRLAAKLAKLTDRGPTHE